MTKPRRQLICCSDTMCYIIASRCVRRAFLCGEDPLTQKSYEHRRKWIEDRLRLLSSLFSLEILSYAIMSNYFHIVLKAIPDETTDWSDKDVVRRWLSIYRGQLADISWFMKCLNEPIARQGNKEDGCTVPDTSIAVRPLAKFIGGETLVNQSSGIHFDFNDYLELLDFTGRAIIQNKLGHIDNCLPSILHRLSIRPKTWFENVLNFEALYYRRFAPQFLLTG